MIVEHYVLDVSVGIKWFLPELHHRIALDLLSRSVKGEIRLHDRLEDAPHKRIQWIADIQ